MTIDRRWTRARVQLLFSALIAAVLTATLFLPQNAFAAPAASPAAGAARGAVSAGLSAADMTRYVLDQTNKVRQSEQNLAEYRQGGDPCILQFRFSSTSVTVKELEACGSRRGLRCTFDGTYPRKKAKSTKKSKGK